MCNQSSRRKKTASLAASRTIYIYISTDLKKRQRKSITPVPAPSPPASTFTPGKDAFKDAPSLRHNAQEHDVSNRHNNHKLALSNASSRSVVRFRTPRRHNVTLTIPSLLSREQVLRAGLSNVSHCTTRKRSP